MDFLYKNRLGLAIGFIVLIAGCIYFYFQKQPATEKIENSIIISVDQNGFVPNKVEVTLGTKIIFKNIGAEDQWPASDNHPTHAAYDGSSLNEHCFKSLANSFDSCGPMTPGKSWTFIPKKIGTFTYHDHLWPHFQASLIVKSSQGTVVQGITRLWNNFFYNKSEQLINGDTRNKYFEKLKTRYTNLVVELDPREVIMTLKNESEQNDRISALCHEILHEIAYTAYVKYGGFEGASKYQNDFCNSGYIHGLLESYFMSTPDPLMGIVDQCGKEFSYPSRLFDSWQCQHGVGHGVMYFTGGDLDESLTLCSTFTTMEAVTKCHGGVYMEAFNQEILAKEKTFLDPENPLQTCVSRKVGKKECYSYIPIYFSQVLQMNFADILKICESVELGYADNCAVGVGAEAIKRNMNDSALVFGMCGQSETTPLAESCASGAVGTYVNQKGSLVAGVALCENAPSNYRDICNLTLESMQKGFE